MVILVAICLAVMESIQVQCSRHFILPAAEIAFVSLLVGPQTLGKSWNRLLVKTSGVSRCSQSTPGSVNSVRNYGIVHSLDIGAPRVGLIPLKIATRFYQTLY